MPFDKEAVLRQAAEIFGILKPSRPNITSLNGQQIHALCSQTFSTGSNGQFYGTSPVRNRSVPETVLISDSNQVRGLSPDPAVRAGQEKILDSAQKFLELVAAYISAAPLWYYRAGIAEHRRLRAGVNLYVGANNKPDIRLLYMAWAMLPVPQFNESFHREFSLLYLPEFEKPAILVFPDLRLTIVLGSGYFGELKKGILRMLWYEASFRNILGLHASTKLVTTKKDKELAVVTLGLSGTGKTTTVMTCQTGYQKFCQDDFVGLDLENLGIWGTELGLFIKTEGVTPETHPEIYHALMDKETFWENIYVDHTGKPDFSNTTLTPNARAVARRIALPREVLNHSIDVHLQDVDGVVFLMCCRHITYPILQALTPIQFAAAFALGHTTGTSAGGAAEAGIQKFIEGTDPFIVRQPGVNSNLLLAALQKIQAEKIPLQCLILNTGSTGEVIVDNKVHEEAEKINIADCSRVLAAVWEKEVEFFPSHWLKTELPLAIPGVKERLLCPEVCFAGHDSYYMKLLRELNSERQARLRAMTALNPEILTAGLKMYPLFE